MAGLRIFGYCFAIMLTALPALRHPLAAAEPATEWKAGVAAIKITPAEPMWMAGYAVRTKPSDGKIHDLYAKALVIEDAQGTRLAIVTTDLIGIPRQLRDNLEAEAGKRFQLPPESLLLNASHTHCGPELRASKASLYGLPPERIKQGQNYIDDLQKKIVGLIGQAIDDLAPAKLSYTHGRAGFAMNRRLKVENSFYNRPNPDGPVDHDVPVLKVENLEGELRGVLFGYACHNTTLGIQQFCGDYAGFAQQYIEEAHPGVTALFMTGCGGDQNPQPRRTIELAKHHGRALANGVEAALISRPREIHGSLRTAIDEVELDFADPPTRGQLEKETKSRNKYARRHAEALLRELDESGQIKTHYPYLVQAIQFGGDLTLVALAGEVVVDYSLRLKTELGEGSAMWVAGYSNDVFGYIPSLRVLQEGGYEGGGAMLYTAFPGPWSPSVERRIIDKTHGLVKKIRAADASSAK